MKTPAWVWDRKLKIYLTLPEGIKQFEDGNWGYEGLEYNNVVSDFYDAHKHLFIMDFLTEGNDPRFMFDWKIILKSPGPSKYQPRQGKARITKVQR